MRPFLRIMSWQQSFKPMIIVVDTTKAGSANNTFVLPIIKATTETVKFIGVTAQTQLALMGIIPYVYATSGVYTVKIESKILVGFILITVG